MLIGDVDAHLSDILTASTITPLLRTNPSLVTRLMPHLPSDLPLLSPPTAEEIHELVSTPQWAEAVASFDAALRTGGLAGVMGGLGLPERAGRGVGEFLEEVGKKAKEEDRGDIDRMEE
jgi:26S proteasome regulatory subunit N13